MPEPKEILNQCFDEANGNLATSNIADADLNLKIQSICFNVSNKAPIRFLLSCLLAKQHNNDKDIRKPYTEIGGDDTYSGRYYDEHYLQSFIIEKSLPCNNTTAYLTPAFRNINKTVDNTLALIGRPRIIYDYTKELIGKVYDNTLTSKQLMIEIFRNLVVLKNRDAERLQALKDDLQNGDTLNELSSEQTINLLIQHLKCKNSSRLPVLIVFAGYESVRDMIGEKPLPLEAHNAADSQTGSIGDIVITLTTDDKKVTSYEMKDKLVTQNDIDLALKKIEISGLDIDNYIFITTES
jgi:DNA adenine methylase